ncbi:VOC family protein [Chitinophaga agrisoli]|uniref:VOC family protein n=1 Tax=Chitinophaga agrisoli TaxID=2607653 RepID=A0A5B2VL59_9BACT|nr:VOC family protein [Chitinophaga agrisoli]KAA2239715.1 VOC family protein [Chitinophaga agrisoli]
MSAHTTYGLTHIALLVKDIDTAVRFYTAVFDARVMYRQPHFAQIQTVGSNDIIVFEEAPERLGEIGTTGGILHFGFRLQRPEDLPMMAARVQEAGGVITQQGEFVPGEPYIFFKDPDGYEVELWYEKED